MSSPSPARSLLTATEFEQLSGEDGYLFELVRGVVVRERGAAPVHGRAQALLAYLLLSWLETRAERGAVLTHTGFVVREDPDTVRVPDVAYVSAGRIPATGYHGGLWRIGPDLAVEVTSPSNTWTELQEKVDDYLAAGSRTVWVVDPPTSTLSVNRTGVDALRLGATDDVTDDEVLPGLRLPLARLFDA